MNTYQFLMARSLKLLIAIVMCAMASACFQPPSYFAAPVPQTKNQPKPVDIRVYRDDSGDLLLSYDDARPLFDRLKTIPYPCDPNRNSQAVCDEAKLIYAQLDKGNWCSRLFTEWYPCKNRNTERLKYAEKLFLDKSKNKYYVKTSDHAVIGKTLPRESIIETYRPDLPCRLPIVNAKDMHPYFRYDFDQSDRTMKMLPGCYGDLIGGGIITIDKNGNSTRSRLALKSIFILVTEVDREVVVVKVPWNSASD